MRYSQGESQRHRRTLAKIHIVEIGAGWPETQPFVHGISQVRNHEIILANDRGKGFETIVSLHRNASPENKIQIGFCQAKADATASLIAPSILGISLTFTY